MSARQLFEFIRAEIREALAGLFDEEPPPTREELLEATKAAMAATFECARQRGLVDEPKYDILYEGDQLIIRPLNDEAKRLWR